MIKLNGEEKAIFKDPITDDGTKKSAKGRVNVGRNPSGELAYLDQTSDAAFNVDLLTTVFKDGKLIKETTLAEIRSRLNGY